MNKTLVASLVGGVILFIWQFMSWSILGVHGSEMAYTDKQEEILDVLASSGLEEGDYFLPNAAPGTSSEEYQAYFEEQAGKPWATISYRKEMNSSSYLNMFRGFVVNTLAVFLLVWLLVKIPELNMSTAITSSVMVGLIGYLTINYINSVWFETNSIPYLIDAVAQWGLCGVWLGWFLGRK